MVASSAYVIDTQSLLYVQRTPIEIELDRSRLLRDRGPGEAAGRGGTRLRIRAPDSPVYSRRFQPRARLIIVSVAASNAPTAD